MNAAPVLMWLGAPDGSCTFLSRSWSERTGQSKDEALGWGWLEAIHPEDRTIVAGAYAEASREKKPYQVEYRLRDRIDGYRWVLDSAAPRLSASGDLLGYVGSLVDNEERKRAELALEHSERRGRVAAEAAGLGIWEWDLRRDLFTFSPDAKSIFGLPADSQELTQGQVQSVVHPDDVAEVLRLSARALDPAVRSQEPYRYRIIRPRDGAIRWIMAHGSAYFDNSDPPAAVSYIGTFQDITEQVEYQSRVEDSEARLRLAMDAGGLAVWELDTATDTLTPSPELNALFGYGAEARPSAGDLRDRFAPGERERLQELGAAALARGERKINVEIHLKLPDGREKWLLLLAQFAPSAAAGDGGRVLGVAMDITGQKQAEVRLSTIARELQHRAKNSLTVVQALASQSFRGDRDLEESLAAFSQRLRALANTADVTSRDWTSADFRDLVIRATNPYRDSSSDPFELSGPPVLLPSKHITAVGMALHELSTNAVKYGALGAAGGRVRLSWTAEAEQLTIKWKEIGGPPVRPPTGRGFGTRLLQAGLLGGDEGSVALDFAADGVECTIRVKLHVEPDNPTAAVS